MTSASTHRVPPATRVARVWLALRPCRSTSTVTSAGPASGAARKCALTAAGCGSSAMAPTAASATAALATIASR